MSSPLCAASVADLVRLMPKKQPPDMSKLLLCPMPGVVTAIAVSEGVRARLRRAEGCRQGDQQVVPLTNPFWSSNDGRGETRRLAHSCRTGTEGPPDTLVWRTPEGIDVKPLYTADDPNACEHLAALPGFKPLVRGPRATMYADRPWTVRQ